TFGIPGDLTPTSRFIKALYSKLSAQKPNTDKELIITANHILNSIAMVTTKTNQFNLKNVLILYSPFIF
ncbi:linear amide C-N hydrolase, partial [Erysipelothrix rhusiopathiae]|nr:linear amide C-N hydrolase [Erysipelothrix rhusiopathiae]